MLVLENVTKTYPRGEQPALLNASLRVERGEFVALLGPSGAGKSTLIRCANGLVRPESGTVRVGEAVVSALHGQDLQTLRRQVAIIFQEFHLIDRHTVLLNVLAGSLGRYPFWRSALRLWDEADVAQARRLLDRVGLSGMEEALAREISGGQRQRVAIARAMMQHPQVLLGDEPVGSLDPVTARSIMQLLRDLTAERGLATVLSLHDVALAREFCARAVGVSAGRIVYDGPMSGVDDAVIAQIYGTALPVVGESSGITAARTSAEVALEKGCGRSRAPRMAEE